MLLKAFSLVNTTAGSVYFQVPARSSAVACLLALKIVESPEMMLPVVLLPEAAPRMPPMSEPSPVEP